MNDLLETLCRHEQIGEQATQNDAAVCQIIIVTIVVATALRGSKEAPASWVIELGSDRGQWAIC